MDIDRVKGYIRLMEESGILELEFEEKGFRIKLKRDQTSSRFEQSQDLLKKKIEPITSSKEEMKGQIELKSEMVGTFYRALKPGDPPCVDIEDMVSSGDILGGIESMKVMNEVRAKASGKIVKVLVEDGHPVEYGQALFLIEELDRGQRTEDRGQRTEDRRQKTEDRFIEL